jgi:NDP-sugar pyrophosphorylase family protein
VTNGDVISTINFGDLLDYHQSSSSVATMCVRKDSYQIPYGVIEIDKQNNLVSSVEKPISSFFINSGIYVLNPDAISVVPHNTFYDLPSLFSKFVEEGRVVKTYEITDYWIDMGRPSDYESVLRQFNEAP